MDTVLTRQHTHLTALRGSPGDLPGLEALLSPVPRLPADTTVYAVDRLFAREPGLSCVAAAAPADQRVRARRR